MNYFMVSVISKDGWSTNLNFADTRKEILKYYFDKNCCILNIVELTEEEYNFINNRKISMNLNFNNKGRINNASRIQNKNKSPPLEWKTRENYSKVLQAIHGGIHCLVRRPSIQGAR